VACCSLPGLNLFVHFVNSYCFMVDVMDRNMTIENLTLLSAAVNNCRYHNDLFDSGIGAHFTFLFHPHIIIGCPS
jgi:hypothetical protein